MIHGKVKKEKKEQTIINKKELKPENATKKLKPSILLD